MIGIGSQTKKKYARSLLCGLEWCPHCGRYHSVVHHRRMAGQFIKILVEKSVGYYVFTIPMEIRHLFHTPGQLRDLERFVTRMLRRELKGYYQGKKGPTKRLRPMKGYSRWHFAGDCHHCRGKGVLYEKHQKGRFYQEERAGYECPACQGTGINGNRWHPHLNVIIDHGWIETDILNKIRELYRRWLVRKTGRDLEEVDAHYDYATGWDRGDLNRKYKYVRYTLRSTFSAQLVETYRREFGVDPIMIFKNFRNTKPLGKYPENFFADRNKIPRPVWEWIESSEFYKGLYFQGTGQAVWRAKNGEIINADMIVPVQKWMDFSKEETIELTDDQYERICTHEVNQILLQ